MSSAACTKVDEAMAEVIDGTASEDLIDHIVVCDRCRDARHDAALARDVVARAGADYRVPNDLTDRLMNALDARTADATPPPADSRVQHRVMEPSVTRAAATAPRLPTPITLPAPESASKRRFLAVLKKRRALIAMTTTFAIAAGAVLGIARKHASVPKDGELTGRIVMAERASADPGVTGLEICKSPTSCKPAKATDSLTAGDRVRTDARTRARLELADGSKIVLDRDTELELVKDAKRTAKIHRGVLAADVVHIEGSQAQMIMPHTTVKVIGTSFILTATDGMSLVEVTRGEVALVDGETGKMLSSVRAGREGRVLAGHAPVVSASSNIGGEGREWMSPEDRSPTAPTQEDEAPLRGIGELRAKKPGETGERDFMQDGRRAVRLAQHHVKVKIAGSVARTEIDETFANDSNEVLEGIYRMPLPPDAQIERLALEVNGMIQEGAFVARDRAAAIWRGVIHNAAPATPAEPDIIWVPGPWHDPALLEWQRGGRFELRIFPIPAKGSRRVILAYTQKLDLHGSMRRYTYPLTYDPKGTTVIDAFDVDVRVMGHKPDVGLKSRGYQVVRSKEPTEEQAEHIALSANAFVPAGDLTVEYALPSDDTELTAWTYAASPQGAQQDGYIALALRPKLPAVSENRDRLYAIVLDSSRSMFGERWKRISSVTAGLVRDLERRDQYFVMTCDTECRALHSEGGALSPSPTSVEDVRRLLSAIEPEGAHDPAHAIQAAIDRAGGVQGARKLHVIYVGDGAATAGTSRPDRIARLLAPSVASREASITTIAIGADADSTMMSALARAGGGTFVRDSGGHPAASLAARAMASTRGASIEHPTIKLPPTLRAVAPESLDTIAEGAETLVIARVDPGVDSVAGSIDLDGMVGGERYHQSFAINAKMSSASGNAFVPRLYAALRIADLERTRGDAAKEEVIRLSQSNAVASRYTSLLVLESEAMFKAFGVERNHLRGGWTGEKADEASTANGQERLRVPLPVIPPALSTNPYDNGALERSQAPSVDGDPSASVIAKRPAKTRSTAPAAACDVPFTIDATGRKKYKLECMGGEPPAQHAQQPPANKPPRREVDEETRKALQALQSAQLEASDGLGSMPSPPPTSRFTTNESLRDNLVPMRRVWTRHASFANGTVSAESQNARVRATDEAFLRDPDNRTKTADSVRAFAAAGRLDEAFDRLRAWLARDPLDTDALLLRSDLAARMGDVPMALRILESVVDLHPDDRAAKLRVANAFDALGDGQRACSHRIAVAEGSTRDLEDLGLAIRCARSSYLTTVADDLFSVVPNDQRKRVERVLAQAVNDALKGDVQLDASWTEPADLDITLVDLESGKRYSWTGSNNPSVRTTSRTPTSTAHEAVGFTNLGPGVYAIEIVNNASPGTVVTGSIDLKAPDIRSRRIPFSTTGLRTTAGTLRIEVTPTLIPIADW